MLKPSLFIVLFHFIFWIYPVLSQDCTAKKIQYGQCNEPVDVRYMEFGKSMSFPVFKGRAQKIVLTLPGKKDYYLAVCSESGEKLNLRIRNGNNPDELIFDNSGRERPQFIEFSLFLTSKLLIEITLPAVYGSDNNSDKECVGMLFYEKDQDH
jgi:hypothetical protein